MEQSEQSQNTKIISAVVVIFLILGIGYVLFGKYRAPGEVNRQASDDSDDQEFIVMVENTPMVNGTLSVPAGFPQDIPIEIGGVLESATTHYPAQDAEQLSVSYQSSRTIAQKYGEYKNYMTASGYQITEGDVSSQVRAIFGTKENVNLSVVISSLEKRTLVQLSYLLKLVLD